MRRTSWVLVAAALIANSALAAAHAPTYILDGYKFSRHIPGVTTAELEAKLKYKVGARVTEDDLDDVGILLTKELEARHIPGQVAAGLVENRGHVWVVIGYSDQSGITTRHLESQSFEGASRIPASALLAATGLKTGAELRFKDIKAARDRILAAYAKAMPHKVVTIKCKIQTRRKNGNVLLTWIISEPK